MESVDHILEFDRLVEKLAEHATSPLGAELALQLKPLDNLSAIEEILTQITELRDILDYDESVPIHGIVDIRPALQKARIAASRLQPHELSAVAQTLSVVRALRGFFSSRSEKIPRLKKIISAFIVLKEIEETIHSAIDSKSLEVKDSASPALANIRKNIIRAQEEARRKIESLLKTLGNKGYLQENLISMRNGRFVLVVKEEFKRKVRGLVHDQSATGSSVFIEPLESLEINNRIRELQVEEEKEIDRILLALSDRVRESIDDIENNIYYLSRLDFLYACAGLSQTLNGHQPQLSEERLISIAQGRHPLLVLRMGEEKVVPLNVELGGKFRTLIVSGPNAGGKTVALKTIGMLVYMVRCGLHIPAQPHTVIGNIDRIFASIGDQQSIENDLSTFSSHIQDLKQIAEEADARSLVLIDEIGSGTDPEEGAALAMALLQYLTERGCLTAVTTHQNVLKAFAYEADGVENASMEFDVSTLQPTYRFRIGIPGSSYAFEIARRMGLPEHLIEKARSLVGRNKDKVEKMILDLEEKIQRYARLNREINVKETELRGLTQLYKEHLSNVKREEKKLIKQAAKEAEEILNQANAAVERAIREIKEQQAKRETIREAKKLLEEKRRQVQSLRQAYSEEKPEETVEDKTIRVGDFVRWEKFNQTGVVASDADKEGRVLLQTDHAKIRVPLKELTRVAAKRKSPSGVVKIRVEKPDAYKNEIDLRGLTSDEAIEKVDHFLDEALLAGFSEIRVIHGKGTGRLRTKINEYLRHHPYVKSARLGYWNEGDSGVTVVELADK